MNVLKIIKYQLYLLQLENYEVWRFLKLLFKKGLLPSQNQRQDLVWTVKACLLYFLAVVLNLFVSGSVVWFINHDQMQFWYLLFPALALLVYLFSLFTFIFLGITKLVIWPIDFIVKQIIIIWAKEKLKKIQNLKVIAIAGSYGKTTMKQVLFEVLSAKYNVAVTPSSINTPIGIAQWVIKRVDLDVEILVVEMGEHYSGDIEYLCKITPPDIAVVMGINEAHLERMKIMENLEATIFEVVSYSKPGALVFLNGNDTRVVKNYKQYVWPDHRVSFFGGKKETNSQFSILNSQFDTDKLGWDMEVEELGKVFINLLGEYATGDVDAAINIAKSLKMTVKEIQKGLTNIKPVEHRLEPIRSAKNVLVIDDSYNGNPAGAIEAIKLLGKFTNRRKIYITPGLVETGKSVKPIHLNLGEELAKTADIVILIKNSVTPYIEMGLLNSGFKSGQILWFNTAQEAHSSLPKILEPNDVIIFQNDWGDQYT